MFKGFGVKVRYRVNGFFGFLEGVAGRFLPILLELKGSQINETQPKAFNSIHIYFT